MSTRGTQPDRKVKPRPRSPLRGKRHDLTVHGWSDLTKGQRVTFDELFVEIVEVKRLDGKTVATCREVKP